MTKSNLMEGFIWLTGTACHQRKPKQEHGAVTWRQELKQRPPEKFLLLCILSLACSVNLLYTSQAYLPRSGTTHSGLGSPNQLAIKKMPTGQYVGGSSLIKLSSSKETLVCVKMTETNQHPTV